MRLDRLFDKTQLRGEPHLEGVTPTIRQGDVTHNMGTASPGTL